MPTRLVLDAMGGDQAPRETVRGALLAAQEYGIDVALVGRQAELEAELAKYPSSHLTVVHADQVVAMDEHPSSALRTKKDSSMAVGLGLLARGEAQGFVSAGNSGAVMAFALHTLEAIEGVERPALALSYPSRSGPCLLLDVGANTDCKALYLLQFACMGSAYYSKMHDVEAPRVALLSTGEEQTKGSQVVQEAHRLLKGSALNFVGNVEGKDLPVGLAQVVVCDGFAGNVVMKLSEGLAEQLIGALKAELSRDLVGRLASAVVVRRLRHALRFLDHTDYGGVPLLGVNGVCIIAHGRSNALAIKSALRVAKQAVEQGAIQAIREAL